jgi:hypothetical protein
MSHESRVIGCFDVLEVAPGKWRFFNIRTNVTHMTYGTEAEIEEAATQQTSAWERQLADKRQGKSWRGVITSETRASEAKKA